MTGKRAKSAERTSFGMPGTTETLGALHSPPVASGELCRLLPSTPFQSSSGECRLIPLYVGGRESIATTNGASGFIEEISADCPRHTRSV